MRQRRYAHGAIQLFVLAALALSCAQLLGDIQVETEPLSPGPGDDIDTDVAPASCELTQGRCSERGTLQFCIGLGNGANAYIDTYDCGSPELCTGGSRPICRQAECQPGEVSCLGATPRVCNEALTGWEELEACPSAAHCSTEPAQCPDGAPCCLVEPCAAGELRCNQGVLEECQADLTGWSPQATCGTPELCLSGLAGCDAGAASCTCQAAACEAGETRCSGASLEICNRGRTGWDPLASCGSEALCEAGRALAPPRCEAPACAPGEVACDGSLLLACREDLTAFDPLDECIGPAFCNAAAGQCDPAPCAVGERSCNGAQIQVCAEDRTGFEPEGPPCATPELCNDADPADVRCDLPACDVDQLNCFGGAQLMACNAGRTAFVPAGPPCPRPDLCSAERRRCDFCVPGRQECTPDLVSSRVCALSGNFFGPETFCPLGCIPETGLCRTCTIGEYICANGNLQRCNDGRSFAPLNRGTDCAGGQQVSCFNNVPVRSNCAPGLVCGGAGQCVCVPGPPFCDGDDLVTCNGTTFVEASPCQGAFGNILTTCDDGDLEQDVCDSADDCEESSGSRCDD